MQDIHSRKPTVPDSDKLNGIMQSLSGPCHPSPADLLKIYHALTPYKSSDRSRFLLAMQKIMRIVLSFSNSSDPRKRRLNTLIMVTEDAEVLEKLVELPNWFQALQSLVKNDHSAHALRHKIDALFARICQSERCLEKMRRSILLLENLRQAKQDSHDLIRDFAQKVSDQLIATISPDTASCFRSIETPALCSAAQIDPLSAQQLVKLLDDLERPGGEQVMTSIDCAMVVCDPERRAALASRRFVVEALRKTLESASSLVQQGVQYALLNLHVEGSVAIPILSVEQVAILVERLDADTPEAQRSLALIQKSIAHPDNRMAVQQYVLKGFLHKLFDKKRDVRQQTAKVFEALTPGVFTEATSHHLLGMGKDLVIWHQSQTKGQEDAQLQVRAAKAMISHMVGLHAQCQELSRMMMARLIGMMKEYKHKRFATYHMAFNQMILLPLLSHPGLRQCFEHFELDFLYDYLKKTAQYSTTEDFNQVMCGVFMLDDKVMSEELVGKIRQLAQDKGSEAYQSPRELTR